jgi:hypothetical protein
VTKLTVAFRHFAKVPTHTSQSDIKNSKKLAQCSAEFFSVTIINRVLSVRCVGMHVGHRIILHSVVGGKKHCRDRVSVMWGENVCSLHYEFDGNC